MSETPSVFDAFTTIAKFNIDDIAKGHFYQLKTSCLSVLVAEIDGPKIEASISVATRVDSNNGVAHTLEHLVFCGSKGYPYRGVLDSLANRCFAQGTNAFTCIDNTTYTISTASEEGLLNILPVYMDHIFNPIICDESFSTEVYHKNDKNEEGGVVFSEMQAKESLEDLITYIELMRCLFKPDSGYSFNSGGELKSIRLLYIDTVKEFHKKYYKPENTLIVIVGAINPKKIIECIINIEATVLSEHILNNKIPRPWINNVISQPAYGIKEITFNSNNLTNGNLLICFEGPDRNNIAECVALNVFASYLSYFEESPLKVKCTGAPNLCSDIAYNTYWFDKTYVSFKFCGAKTDKFDEIIEAFKSIISELQNKGLNDDFLKTVINFEYCSAINSFEQSPHNKISQRGIDYFLYGQSAIDFLNIMDLNRFYHELTGKSAEFWNSILTKYFDFDRSCIVKAIPKQDDSLADIVEKMQSVAIEPLKKKFKPKIKGQLPPELIEKFPIPSMDNIDFHSIKTLCNFGGFNFDDVSFEGFEIFNVPLAMQIDDIRSNVLSVTLCICLGKVEKEMLYYLPLASTFPIEMPIVRKGVLMMHDDVKKELDHVFFQKNSDIGWGSGLFNVGILSYYYFISLKTDISHYESAVSWIKDLIFNYQCDTNQLKELIVSTYNLAISICEDGKGAVDGLSNFITFKKNTINHIQSVFFQIKYLKCLNKDINSKEKEVLQKFERIQKFLRTGSNIQAHLACDFQKLGQLNRSPHSIWQLNFSEYALYESKTPRTPSHFNYDQIEDQTFYHQIIPLSSCDSSYLIQTIPSIRSFRDPDYPALTVLLEFLSAFEGPLWKKLRGKGLAYSALIFCEPSDGLIYLKISKSSDIVQAYVEAVDIMRSYSGGSTTIVQDELESAISGTIFEAVNQESNICDAALIRMMAQLKGLDYEFHREFIKKVSKVTLKDMELMAKKHLNPIVDACCSHIAISCPSGEVDKITAGFKEINISLEQYVPPDDSEDLIVG